MRRRVLIVVPLILAAAAAGIFQITSGRQLTPQQIAELEDKERRRAISLEERAQLAKARGKDRVYLPAVASLYMECTSPDELRGRLPGYTVLIAEWVGQKTYVRDGGIRTWYKFKTIDTFRQSPPLSFLAPTREPVDAELLPIRENELLINRPGGSLTVNGVEIVQSEQDVAAFTKSQRYLLLLSFEPSSRIGEIILGGQSILPINPDSTLDPTQAPHMLQRVVAEHYAGSLEQLKQTLR